MMDSLDPFSETKWYLSDEKRQLKEGGCLAPESGVPHYLARPSSPWPSGRTFLVMVRCVSIIDLVPSASFGAICAGVQSGMRRMCPKTE